MQRRDRVLLALTASVVVVSLLGCTTVSDSAPEATELERVRVSGSGTCIPLLHLLTDNYPTDVVEWRYLPGLHSGGGITGVENGELEIGAVSRELSDEEAALGLVYTPLSNDGIVIAVHPSVTIDGLTTQQVKEVYAGTYSNWSELGGPDLPITILDRNEDESAKIIMRKYVFGPDLVMAPQSVSLYYESDMIDGVQSTAGAIGYFSLGYSISRDIPVTHLALDGVDATVENVESGTYPVVRPLGVVTSPEASADIRAFLEWATSEEARGLLRANGFSPAE